MKILVIHNHWLERGGEDEVVDSEVKMLQSFGHEVVIYEKSNEEIKSFSLLKKLRFLIKDIVWSETTYREVKEIIQREKPDIAHIHNIFIVMSPSIYDALSEENIPIVQTLHNYRLICPTGVLYRKGKICEECADGNFTSSIVHRCWRNSYFLSYFLARTLGIHLKNKTFREKIDCYIVLSEFSKNNFIKWGFPKDKLFVKPNFFELNVSKRSGVGNFALFVGRLVDYKGVKNLVLAFKELDEGCLKIIGDGPLYKELNSLIAETNTVELLGRLSYEDTIEYIKKCRFIIVPSECYENMPRVILESFACGAPVVASRLGAIGEIIEDKKTGVLFKPGGTHDLASKIRWAWENHKKMDEMGRQAKNEYCEKYCADRNYDILMNIYNKTLAVYN